jgi:hypothetical protein
MKKGLQVDHSLTENCSIKFSTGPTRAGRSWGGKGEGDAISNGWCA